MSWFNESLCDRVFVEIEAISIIWKSCTCRTEISAWLHNKIGNTSNVKIHPQTGELILIKAKNEPIYHQSYGTVLEDPSGGHMSKLDFHWWMYRVTASWNFHQFSLCPLMRKNRFFASQKPWLSAHWEEWQIGWRRVAKVQFHNAEVIKILFAGGSI